MGLMMRPFGKASGPGPEGMNQSNAIEKTFAGPYARGGGGSVGGKLSQNHAVVFCVFFHLKLGLMP